MKNNSFTELKELMEGKTVLHVEPPEATEAICRFHMSDGSVFRLHATDLGFWVEKTIEPGSSYETLDQLFNDYERYVYHMDERTPIKIEVSTFSKQDPELEILIQAPDGHEFKATVQKDSPDGLLLDSDKAEEKIEYASELGSSWRMAFRISNSNYQD